MSKEYEGRDPLEIAKEAETDLNSHGAKTGTAVGRTSADESGVDESVTSKFPGSTVVTGSAASGAGDNRDIPVEEGGEINKLGRSTKARDFEGEGGPEDKQARFEEENPGDDSVRSNIR